MTTRTPWGSRLDSECPECHHGPLWHGDPLGCIRANASMCACPRRYSPDATGPSDFVIDECPDCGGRDGTHHATCSLVEHWDDFGVCAACGADWAGHPDPVTLGLGAAITGGRPA